MSAPDQVFLALLGVLLLFCVFFDGPGTPP